MIQMTMQVSDELAQRCQCVGRWLPAVIELSFIGFRTLATAAGAEVIEFLSENPSPEELLGFYMSESAQMRLRRLLALNEAGYLSEAENAELDELQRLEHIIIMLKTQAAISIRSKN